MSKFDSRFTEVLYNISMNGGHNEEYSPGHDGYVDHYCLFLTSKRGHIIHNDNQGFITLYFSGTKQDAQSTFDGIIASCEEYAVLDI